MEETRLSFEEIHAAYRPRILRYLTSLAGEMDAEDLTQEVFVKVSRGLAGFRGEAQLSTWIYRIATNTATDRLRRTSTRQSALQTTLDEEAELHPAPSGQTQGDRQPFASAAEERILRQEMNRCVHQFIEQLPPDYRTVLVLSDLEDLPDKDIADILGISLGAAKIRLHRGREKLKQALAAHCGWEWIEGNEFLPDLKDAFEGYPKE
jgi:RNA polymerase sigma-70 factor (ECF subfamily)